jgi:hypothetical protein
MTHTAEPSRKDVYSKVTDRIIGDLEQGIRPWLKPWNGNTPPDASQETAQNRQPSNRALPESWRSTLRVRCSLLRTLLGRSIELPRREGFGSGPRRCNFAAHHNRPNN